MRLYPAYIVSVALTDVYLLWVGKYDVSAVLVNLAMLRSFIDTLDITTPYRKLAFENSFYGLLTAVLPAGAFGQIDWLALGVARRHRGLSAPRARTARLQHRPGLGRSLATS